LRSCPELDPSDPKTFYRQRECVWGKAIGGIVHHDTTASHPGYTEKAAGFAVGAQKEIADHLFIEGVGQYEAVTIDGNNFEQTGHQVSAGVALKKEIGNLELSGSLSGGVYGFDHLRSYSTLGGSSSASSDITGRFVSGEARIAAIFEQRGTYVKPSASIALTRMWQDGFTETGSGGLNWKVDSVDHTAVYIRPKIELGRAFDMSGSAAVAFLRAGLSHQFTDPSTSVSTSLAGSGGGLDDLKLEVETYRTDVELEAGLNADFNKRLSLEVLGKTALSENSEAFGGQLKLRWQF